jgi:SAM-dependent methyltransferase
MSARPASEGRASRDAIRRAMFLAQDGVVLATTLRALDELEILDPSLEVERSLAELRPSADGAGIGALRVAVHGLASTGWLAEPPALDPESTHLRWTDRGRLAMAQRSRYVALGEFLGGFTGTDEGAWSDPWDPGQIERFLTLVGESGPDGGLPADLAELIRSHLDGGLVVPAMLWLHETGGLGERGPALPPDQLGEAIGRLFAELGWTGAGGEWTELGNHARAFGLNFGGVATYLPLLARLPELYRGELNVAPDPAAAESEWHVHRALNVRISTAAHRRYFADSESLFVEIFNREPVEEQPRFVADMGCGEGSWLLHLHRLVAERTLRGAHLDAQPLTMVGIDPDLGALDQARRNLEATGAPSLLIRGDVTDPDRLALDLAEQGLAIEDGLHIRSFIDHERRFLGADPAIEIPGLSTGVYMDAAGGPLSGEEVERDLVAHLRRWARHVPKHGMVVLEAHCTPPEVVARNLGSLHGIAFDAHQAYSKQYPVDHAAFVESCHQAGLQTVSRHERRYPANRPFTAVSLNRLIPAGEEPALPALRPGAERADTWQADPGADLEDGLALQRILFRGGDIRFLAAWGSAATGFVVAGALEAIEARIDRVEAGEAIRVLDYGAGTGTATIELLKACREGDVEARLAHRGATLEMHLVDLPSGWYAQGYDLLRDCAWTRFHSLRGEGGGFRRLSDVLGGATVDVAMANMVFHLIPVRALERTVDGLASVIAPAGRLLWSAPDLGPPRPGSILLHDPNRAVRELWLERAGGELDAEVLREGRERAERRIQPRPLASDVTATLGTRFEGETKQASYEMLDRDIVAGLLVPSNQAEFLPEIPDRGRREAIIRELMLDVVLPRLRKGPAGTGHGLNLHWTLGAYTRRS